MNEGYGDENLAVTWSNEEYISNGSLPIQGKHLTPWANTKTNDLLLKNVSNGLRVVVNENAIGFDYGFGGVPKLGGKIILGMKNWSFSTEGSISGTPAIGNNGIIYIGSSDKNIYAIDASGNLKWKFKTNGDITSSPAIGKDGTIYIGSDKKLTWREHSFFAINPNGSLKWSFGAGAAVRTKPAIASDGTIIFGSDDGSVYAVNPDGTKKWSYRLATKLHSSPSISSVGTIYIGSHDNYLHALTPNGSKKWSFRTTDDIVSSPAIGQDGTVYVGSLDGNLYAINKHGTVNKRGVKKWSFKTSGGISSSPTIGDDGTIYVGSENKYLYAITPEGSKKWSFKTNGAVSSSPTIGKDGKLYFGSQDFYLYAINKTGDLNWSFKTQGNISSSGKLTQDGSIYFGSDDHNLYSVKTGSFGAANSHWPSYGRNSSNTSAWPSKPKIISDVKNISTAKGGSALFYISVSGEAPITYQWYKDGNIIDGENRSILTINNASEKDIGIYSVWAKNSAGKTYSSTAELNVIIGNAEDYKFPNIININPSTQFASIGDKVNLEVIASGINPLSFQWIKDGKAISGANNSIYKVNKLSNNDFGKYSVKVTNSFGSVLSKDVKLESADLINKSEYNIVGDNKK